MKIAEHRAKLTMINDYLEHLESQTGLLTEFDERLWVSTLDNVVVDAYGTLVFQFKDGSHRAWGEDK